MQVEVWMLVVAAATMLSGFVALYMQSRKTVAEVAGWRAEVQERIAQNKEKADTLEADLKAHEMKCSERYGQIFSRLDSIGADLSYLRGMLDAK